MFAWIVALAQAQNMSRGMGGQRDLKLNKEARERSSSVQNLWGVEWGFDALIIIFGIDGLQL